MSYKLDRLDAHMKSSHGLLNELRTLKRLLVGERVASLVPAQFEPQSDSRLRESRLRGTAAGKPKAQRRMPIP